MYVRFQCCPATEMDLPALSLSPGKICLLDSLGQWINRQLFLWRRQNNIFAFGVITAAQKCILPVFRKRSDSPKSLCRLPTWQRLGSSESEKKIIIIEEEIDHPVRKKMWGEVQKLSKSSLNMQLKHQLFVKRRLFFPQLTLYSTVQESLQTGQCL